MVSFTTRTTVFWASFAMRREIFHQDQALGELQVLPASEVDQVDQVSAEPQEDQAGVGGQTRIWLRISNAQQTNPPDARSSRLGYLRQLEGKMEQNDLIQMREWERLKYYDPSIVLTDLRRLDHLAAESSLPKNVKTLRRNDLKKYREGRDAALFCLGMTKVQGTTVFFARFEAQDYDFVTLWQNGDEAIYTPVQLKEVVPESLNPNSNVNDTLAKLTKYSGSDRTVVALRVNRKIHLDFSSIQFPNIRLGGIWLYGAAAPDQQKWFIYGDLLKEPDLCEFEYPS